MTESHAYGGATSGEGLIFRMVIRYSYRLGERTYSSEKTGLTGQTFTSFSAAQREANRYSQGQTVQVHVSPENPERSMIKIGSKWRYWLGLWTSLAFVGLGCILLLASFAIHM